MMNRATDTVTVFKRKTLERHVVTGVYWYGEKRIGIDGHGVSISAEPSCIFPYDAISQMEFTLEKGDYIALGTVYASSITDINSFNNVFTVKSINSHLKGSKKIQHITAS